jgi:hypothetical protein
MFGPNAGKMIMSLCGSMVAGIVRQNVIAVKTLLSTEGVTVWSLGSMPVKWCLVMKGEVKMSQFGPFIVAQ